MRNYFVKRNPTVLEILKERLGEHTYERKEYNHPYAGVTSNNLDWSAKMESGNLLIRFNDCGNLNIPERWRGVFQGLENDLRLFGYITGEVILEGNYYELPKHVR